MGTPIVREFKPSPDQRFKAELIAWAYKNVKGLIEPLKLEFVEAALVHGKYFSDQGIFKWADHVVQPRTWNKSEKKEYKLKYTVHDITYHSVESRQFVDAKDFVAIWDQSTRSWIMIERLPAIKLIT